MGTSKSNNNRLAEKEILFVKYKEDPMNKQLKTSDLLAKSIIGSIFKETIFFLYNSLGTICFTDLKKSI